MFVVQSDGRVEHGVRHQFFVVAPLQVVVRLAVDPEALPYGRRQYAEERIHLFVSRRRQVEHEEHVLLVFFVFVDEGEKLRDELTESLHEDFSPCGRELQGCTSVGDGLTNGSLFARVVGDHDNVHVAVGSTFTADFFGRDAELAEARDQVAHGGSSALLDLAETFGGLTNETFVVGDVVEVVKRAAADEPEPELEVARENQPFRSISTIVPCDADEVTTLALFCDLLCDEATEKEALGQFVDDLLRIDEQVFQGRGGSWRQRLDDGFVYANVGRFHEGHD